MSMLLSAPPLGLNTLVPREYQMAAFSGVRREFAAGHRRTLIVHATGSGKTVTASIIARATVEKGGRVLVLAHREELLDQFENTLDRVGIVSGREKAESRARATFEPMVVTASVQTLRGKRLESWDPGYFRLVIIDEAHHSTANSYMKILRHFRRAYVLGITATPQRADDDELSDVYNSVAHAFPMLDAILAGYLCRPLIVRKGTIDLRGIRRTKHDFNLDDLAARIAPQIEMLANLTHGEMEDRPTLAFTPDVPSSQALATAVASLGRRADYVHGDDPDRAEKIQRYRNGDLQFLSSCELLNEGADFPMTACLGLYRPTKSGVIASQQVGRGMRPGKPNCLLIDPGFLTDQHDLFSPAELFDTNETDHEVFGIVGKLIADGKRHDLLDVVEQARGMHAAREVLRIKAREREVRGRRVAYDPISAYEALGMAKRGPMEAKHDLATEAQRAALERFGITGAGKLSKRRASRLLDELVPRAKQGLATFRQIRWLIARDVDPAEARAMTRQEASEMLERIFGRTG